MRLKMKIYSFTTIHVKRLTYRVPNDFLCRISWIISISICCSIAEERHPAANEFEEQEKLVDNYNDCVTTRKRFLDIFQIKRDLIKRNFVYE